MKKALHILQHLRIPFSFFLLPVYIFALGISPNIGEDRIILTFVVLHLFIYPASSAYNAYFDKDKANLSSLKTTPVSIGLYYTSLIFEFIGIALAWLISMEFALLVFTYGLASKAFSHPGIRLKKHPWFGWLFAGFFQGVFIFYMAYVGVNDFGWEIALKWKVVLPGLIISAFLWSTYPMTQINQHKEDDAIGDYTLSLLLGIRGTFLFTLIAFLLVTLGFEYYFLNYHTQEIAFAFLLFITPTVLCFLIWFALVHRDEKYANHRWTMTLYLISAICFNAFFVYFFLETSHLGQLNM